MTDHPANLAQQTSRDYVVTPVVDRVSQAIATTLRADSGRLVIAVPPQEGLKSTLLRWSVAWWMDANPDQRILYVSYDTAAARLTGRFLAGTGRGHSTSDSRRWGAADGTGRLHCAGPGTPFTGTAFDCIFVDDVHRGRLEVENRAKREYIRQWWETVALCRLAPKGSVVVTQSRWRKDDFAGTLIGEGWPLEKIAAISNDGEYLTSARGTSPDDWERLRRFAGESTWSALYQQDPVD